MIVFTCISFFFFRTKKLSSGLLVLRDVYKSYVDRGPGLTQKNFQEPGHETRVRGRQDVALQQQRRHDEGLECRHRRTNRGARPREFCLFQRQLLGAHSGQVQYRLQGRSVAHLRRAVGGGLLPCPARHFHHRNHRRKDRCGMQQWRGAATEGRLVSLALCDRRCLFNLPYVKENMSAVISRHVHFS